jgi:hypothetical protein
MTPEQGELFRDGPQRRDEGIRRVLDNTNPMWRRQYASCVQHWLQQLPVGTEFTGEDLRLCAQPIIGNPHHHNVWGGMASQMIHAWLKANLIKSAGMAAAHAPRAHARIYPAYRKVK